MPVAEGRVVSHLAAAAVCLVLVSSPGLRAHGSATAIAGSGWELVALDAESYREVPEKTRPFWLGLKNTSGERQVVCLCAVEYAAIDENHGIREAVRGFRSRLAPGACSDPADMNLVLPGETLFVYGGVPIPDWAVEGQQLLFFLTAVTRPAKGSEGRRWVVVEGTARLRRAAPEK